MRDYDDEMTEKSLLTDTRLILETQVGNMNERCAELQKRFEGARITYEHYARELERSGMLRDAMAEFLKQWDNEAERDLGKLRPSGSKY